MSKLLPIYTAVIGCLASASVVAQQLNGQVCLVKTNTFDAQQLMPAQQIKVEADYAEMLNEQQAKFAGDVVITSDSALIKADSAEILDNGESLSAQGNVAYQDAQVNVASKDISISNETQELTLADTSYQLNAVNGRGDADKITLSKERGLILSDVLFTTCAEGQEDWLIKASSISLEKGKYWGEAKHTRFYIAGVPVMYLPYFAFPVTNQRQTGFLFPEISNSSSTGVDVSVPFYWNIAPNYDYTITPRLMSQRGVQLKNELRHLDNAGSSQLNVEYLANDSALSSNDARYFYRLEHASVIANNWILDIDFSGISDSNYLIDLGSDFFNRADTSLNRMASVNYYADNFSATLALRDFAMVDEVREIYRALPDFSANYRYAIKPWLRFDVNTQASRFENTNPDLPKATRVHIEPSLTLPYRRPWGELTGEVSLLHTVYDQSNVENTSLATNVSRTLGQARLFGKLNYESTDTWLGKNHKVTFEPTAQYLYTSYQQQDDIGLYDSTRLLTDVTALFRGQEFSGLDRINDNNQFTLGFTSRVYDEHAREQFVVSVGQIFYLADAKLFGDAREDNRSALVAEMDGRFSSRWFYHAEMQMAASNNKFDRGSFSLEYRRSKQDLIQITQRYIRDLSGETISQAGISASWRINPEWQWVGRAYVDREQDRSIESYFGVQYESCCWSLKLVAHRSLTSRYDDIGSAIDGEFESGVALQFSFKGIGSNKTSRNMLEEGLFGYRQPYNLNY